MQEYSITPENDTEHEFQAFNLLFDLCKILKENNSPLLFNNNQLIRWYIYELYFKIHNLPESATKRIDELITEIEQIVQKSQSSVLKKIGE